MRFKHVGNEKMPNFQTAKLIKGHKYMTPDSNIYPSVTTILGKTKPEESKAGLDRWRDSVGHDVANYIMREAATIGTESHELNEAYINDTPYPDTRLISRAHHENFKPYLNRIDMVYGTELPLYSDKLELAGTADCIAEFDGVPSIIDYKTKRSPQKKEWMYDYHLQTSCYATMFEEITGISITQGVIIVSSEKNTIQTFLSNTAKYYQEFLVRLNVYNKKFRPRQYHQNHQSDAEYNDNSRNKPKTRLRPPRDLLSPPG